MAPLLTSILVPCWNALPLTRVCLGQVARHTTLPFELIVIDNGSSDGTGAWLRAFGRELRRAAGRWLAGYRVISNLTNRGYPAAMNQGLRRCRGDAVVFGNADAAVGPLWLEGMRKALAAGRRVGGVAPSCNATLQSLRRPWRAEPLYADLAGMERLAAALAMDGREAFFTPARGLVAGFWFLAPRAALRRVGGFDERFSPGGCEDWDLQWRLRRRGLAVGFAGRAFVHHVGFGCGAGNGLSQRRFYGGDRLRLFARLHPDAAEAGLELRTPVVRPAR